MIHVLPFFNLCVASDWSVLVNMCVHNFVCRRKCLASDWSVLVNMCVHNFVCRRKCLASDWSVLVNMCVHNFFLPPKGVSHTSPIALQNCFYKGRYHKISWIFLKSFQTCEKLFLIARLHCILVEKSEANPKQCFMYQYMEWFMYCIIFP